MASCSVVSLIPGSQGPAGAAGTNGTNGTSAFTTCNSFTMPAELASVTITVGSTTWMALGQILWIIGGAIQGYFKVTALISSTQCTIQNLKNTAASAYTTNSAPGSIFPNLSQVVAAGLQGPSGAAVAGALLAANNLSDVANAGTSRTNLGLGTAALKTTGVANTNLPSIDTTFTNGDAVFGTGIGLQTKSAATARTALGLGTMAIQAASAIAVSGGAIEGTTVGQVTPAAVNATSVIASGLLQTQSEFFTAGGSIQSLLAASAIGSTKSRIRVAGNAGPVTLISTPTIVGSLSVDGQHLFIQGTSDVNTVTFQSEVALAGTKLHLGAATRTLGNGDILYLLWDLNAGLFYEVSFTNNN